MTLFFAATLVVLFGFVYAANAAVPYTINYQGKLLNSASSPVADGTYSMTFRLYDTASGGTHLWAETQSVTVQSGLFSVLLGTSTSLSTVDFNQQLYLGINVAGDGEMSPRKALATVPTAFEAENAQAVGGVASTSLLRSDQVDTASGLLTFTGGIISNSSSTITHLTSLIATTTTLVINGESFTDLTGTALTNNSGVLSVDTSVLDLRYASSTDLDTSAELATILLDETGTGSAVFSANPTFTGTVNGSALTLSSTLALSGSAANIALGSNFLSGDGDDEGIYVNTAGNVGIGTTTPNSRLTISGGNVTVRELDHEYDALSLIAGNSSGLISVFNAGSETVRLAGTGNSYITNNLGLGTNTPGSKLTILGGDVVVREDDDGADAAKLWAGNSAGALSLYNAGTEVVHLIGTGNSYINGSNLGIGTTTPGYDLTIDGSVGITGALYDNTYSAGTAGYVLQSTGSGFQWVATSTLGISGGGSALTVGTDNQIPFSNAGGTDLEYASNFVFDGTNLGIGTTSPNSLLSLYEDNFSGAGTVGLSQFLTTQNSVASAVQLGNQLHITASNTATTTLVGSMVKITDTTGFGNIVRGLEVQADTGTNTQGENTALSGFARTFGVRGYTSADAGGLYEPAGGLFETGGTTQGNAIRAYSSSITTSELVSIFQDTSDFTGTGLLMNLGNSTGSFSSTTSRFIDLQNAGTSKFTVTAHGTTTIGDGTTNNMAGLQIGYGGLCVDNDGSCVASTTGTISAVDYLTGNSDLAEMYFSSQDLLPGELVTTDGFLSIERAHKNEGRVLGVVSTKPGLTLGSDDSSLQPGQTAYPLALTGRVPVRLSTENGSIQKGDPLTLSSIPGVAMKATEASEIVGYALEAFNGTHAYTEGWVNQFGDDIAEPNYDAINVNTKANHTNGCHFGGGTHVDATTTELCDVTAPTNDTTENDALMEAQQSRYEAEQAALQALRDEPAESAIVDDKKVYVGQVIMFVSSGVYVPDAQIVILNELTSTSTDLVLDAQEGDGETLWARLKILAQHFVDDVLSVAGLKAQVVESQKLETSELCVDDVCLTADKLRTLLEGPDTNGQNTEVPDTQDNTGNETDNSNDGGQTQEDPTQEETYQTEEGETDDGDNTDGNITASSTDAVSSTTEETTITTDQTDTPEQDTTESVDETPTTDEEELSDTQTTQPQDQDEVDQNIAEEAGSTDVPEVATAPSVPETETSSP